MHLKIQHNNYLNMILRLVKLDLIEGKDKTFIEIFKESKPFIESMKGCLGVKLKKDINNPGVYFTYSFWESENDLNAYRNTQKFKQIWGRTKLLFQNKAEAWSIEEIEME